MLSDKESGDGGLKKMLASSQAPQALGPYSQGLCVDGVAYLSGQIALLPETMQLVEGGIKQQTEQVFRNLAAVAKAANSTLANCVKLNIFVTNLVDFEQVNKVMSQFFEEPYPARACVQVAALPKNALIEIDAIVILNQ